MLNIYAIAHNYRNNKVLNYPDYYYWQPVAESYHVDEAILCS